MTRVSHLAEATRYDSAEAVVAVLEAARLLVVDVPTDLATGVRVYAALQRLCCDLETTLHAVDRTRALMAKAHSG